MKAILRVSTTNIKIVKGQSVDLMNTVKCTHFQLVNRYVKQIIFNSAQLVLQNSPIIKLFSRISVPIMFYSMVVLYLLDQSHLVNILF